ncbi:MAG: hypothetical protein H6R13_3323 [Proteobacteria bacterium]|nr:hypothetical protein [Pseudomonadota bacterium]
MKVVVVQMDGVDADEIGAEDAEFVKSRQWSQFVLLEIVGNFLLRFVDVAVHRQIQLLG